MILSSIDATMKAEAKDSSPTNCLIIDSNVSDQEVDHLADSNDEDDGDHDNMSPINGSGHEILILAQDLSQIVDVPIPVSHKINNDPYRNSRNRRSSSLDSVGCCDSDGDGFVDPSTDGGSSARRSTSPLDMSKTSSRSTASRIQQNNRKRRSSGNDNSTGYQMRKSMWNNLVKDEGVWEEDLDEHRNKKKLGIKKVVKLSLSNLLLTIRMTLHEKFYVLKSHPNILIMTAFVFGCLLAIGLYVVLTLAQEQENSLRDEAQDLAARTGSWFSDALDRALLPVYALSRLVEQLDMFKTIPEEIGSAFLPGSLPFLPPNEAGGFMRRNMTNTSCQDPKKIARFNKIAASIKRGAKMEGIVVNLQVAPLTVVCYAYPLVNTEDFEPPKMLNSTGIIGLDNLSEPQRSASAERTVRSDGVVIAGPLSLRQCSDCDPTVKTAFIAWVTIDALTERQSMNIQGEKFMKWGFATALINWAELVDRSDINEKFVEKGLKYQLTRTDRTYNAESEDYDVKVNVLAGEEEFEMEEKNYESIDFDTANNVWNIKVGYDEGFVPTWKTGAIAGAFAGAFLVSFMFMIICIESQSHHDLLRDMLPLKALRKIEKGKTCVEKYDNATVFFSDIVGYTTMSAEMSAIQVMKMLNEFYTEVDKIASKHNVYKIQTIGDAYMVTGGVPDRCSGSEGARNVALFAIETMEFAENFRTSTGAKVIIRAGINSGPLVAGVVGTKRPQYTVFGDTVNAAARMESTSKEMRIQCSDVTCELLRESKSHIFFLEKRGTIAVKGKGDMNTWFIEGAAGIVEEEKSLGPRAPVDEGETFFSSDNGCTSNDGAEMRGDEHLHPRV